MIQKLLLKNFGKFRGQAFALKPVTVFVGKNEAGKTTLCDALFDKLCAPGANINEGKRLRDRYGEAREAELEFAAETWSFDADEFANVYAVRAGDLTVGFKKNAAWAETIKNAIFSGGIDAQKIIADLRTKADDKGTLKHSKALQKAKVDYAEAETELERLLEDRNMLLQQEVGVKTGGEGLKEIENQIYETEKALLAQRGLLEIQEKIRERKAIQAQLKNLQQQKELEKEIDASAIYATDTAAEEAQLRRALADLAGEENILVGESKTLKVQAVQAADEIRRQENEIEKKSSPVLIAEKLRKEIFTKRAKEKESEKSYFQKPLLVFGGGVALMALVAFAEGRSWLADIPLPSWLPGVALMVTAAIIVKLAYRKKTEITIDRESDERLLAETRDAWLNASENALAASTLDGAAEELQRYINLHDQLRQRLQHLKETQRSREGESIAVAGKIEALHTKKDAVEKSLRLWCEKYRVADVTDYAKKRQRYDVVAAELQKLVLINGSAIESAKLKDTETLQATLAVRLGHLDKEIIDEEWSAAKEQRAKSEVMQREEQLKNLLKERDRRAEAVHRGSGAVEARMVTLPAEIYASEQAVEALRQKIDQLEIARKAAEYALAIFENIKTEQADIFESLGDEISKYFSGFFPESRAIKISAFETKAIQIEDSAGDARALEHVSTATVQAFYLSARLAFALKTRGSQPGIIILDEPFASFDAARQENAIRFLKKFQKEHNWQLIVFTKDIIFQKSLTKQFADTENFIVHEL